MSRLRVAMLGYGAVAHEHARVLEGSSAAELVAGANTPHKCSHGNNRRQGDGGPLANREPTEA